MDLGRRGLNRFFTIQYKTATVGVKCHYNNIYRRTHSRRSLSKSKRMNLKYLSSRHRHQKSKRNTNTPLATLRINCFEFAEVLSQTVINAERRKDRIVYDKISKDADLLSKQESKREEIEEEETGYLSDGPQIQEIEIEEAERINGIYLRKRNLAAQMMLEYLNKKESQISTDKISINDINDFKITNSDIIT